MTITGVPRTTTHRPVAKPFSGLPLAMPTTAPTTAAQAPQSQMLFV